MAALWRLQKAMEQHMKQFNVTKTRTMTVFMTTISSDYQYNHCTFCIRIIAISSYSLCICIQQWCDVCEIIVYWSLTDHTNYVSVGGAKEECSSQLVVVSVRLCVILQCWFLYGHQKNSFGMISSSQMVSLCVPDSSLKVKYAHHASFWTLKLGSIHRYRYRQQNYVINTPF